MRIGIVPTLHADQGGVYQYSMTMLDVLLSSDITEGDQMVLVSTRADHEVLDRAHAAGWEVAFLPGNSDARRRVVRHVLPEPLHSAVAALVRKLPRPRWKPRVYDVDKIKQRPEMQRWFEKLNLDFVIYPTPRALAFEAGTRFVMCIHDLQHRLQPHFEEVSARGEWEAREYRYRNAIREASLIIAESEVGKEDIISLYGDYGARPERIEVLPYLPPPYVSAEVTPEDYERVSRLYRLPERYLFYPAQFWPHKNHVRIIEALHLLRQECGTCPNLVLSGGHSGQLRERTFAAFEGAVRRFGLGSSVHYLGYVPDEDVAALYMGAVALVMPTYFGPTNIPFLEAWARSCPVITSNIRGIREQVGEAAVLVDPSDPNDLAQGIHRLWDDEEFRVRLVGLGSSRLNSYGRTDYENRLRDALGKAKVVIRGSHIEN